MNPAFINEFFSATGSFIFPLQNNCWVNSLSAFSGILFGFGLGVKFYAAAAHV
jgi:hypothetical protein